MNLVDRAIAGIFISMFLATAAFAQSAGTPPEQLGTVIFLNSCQPSVQAKFTRAVALLHSFWWREGERAFREVLAEDPACAGCLTLKVLVELDGA